MFSQKQNNTTNTGAQATVATKHYPLQLFLVLGVGRSDVRNRVNAIERKCRNGKNSTKIKWSLGLDRCTPGYKVLVKTNREKIRIKAGR